MAFNTGNPIGSKDVKDLFDNAENLDNAVNSTVNDTFVDRLGTTRKTYKKMQAEADAIVAAVNDELTGAKAEADRAKTEADNAATSAANAVAVVTGGTASLTPEAGKIPIAGAVDKIDDNWLAYNIPALSAQYPGLNVVDATFYDTSKDSDGGQWIHKTAELSYGKEAVPGGRYLGAYDNFAAAVAAGGIDGEWYYNPTNGAFWEIISNETTNKEIYRAGSAHFPSQVLVVATSSRVIIFDTSGHQLTMWMVFGAGSGTVIRYPTISSVAAAQGLLLVGNNSTVGGYTKIDYVADIGEHYNDTDSTVRFSSVVNRDAQTLTKQAPIWLLDKVNALAITTPDNAPTDPATGLKIPTVAVATDGGNSIITDSGTVWDTQTGTKTTSIAFGKENELYTVTDAGTVSVWDSVTKITADGIAADSTVANVLGTAAIVEGA